MRTVESSLTNAVKRFGGRICDGYWNKGTKTRQARQPEAQALQVPEPLAYRNNHGAKTAGSATTEQTAQEGQAIESAGAVGVLSRRHLKSSKHDLRDDRFCHSAHCSSWRSKMHVRLKTGKVPCQ